MYRTCASCGRRFCPAASLGRAWSRSMADADVRVCWKRLAEKGLLAGLPNKKPRPLAGVCICETRKSSGGDFRFVFARLPPHKTPAPPPPPIIFFVRGVGGVFAR